MASRAPRSPSDCRSSSPARRCGALLSQLQGTSWLVASLLYGSGLRLMEGLRLRVKDLAIERGEIIVREPKGGRDRVTTLPAALRDRCAPTWRSCTLVPGGAPARVGRASRCPLPWRASTRTLPPSGAGNTCSPPPPGHRCPDRARGQASSAREEHPARGAVGGAQGWHQQTRQLPHPASLLCHPSAGGWLRHPHGAGASRAQRRENHDDLHPRDEQGRERGAQSPGP